MGLVSILTAGNGFWRIRLLHFVNRTFAEAFIFPFSYLWWDR
jgi:hypothetical protein